jgi:hypothetical protein
MVILLKCNFAWTNIFTNFRDLGIHIDGFIALAAHTLVVGKAPSEENE